MFYFYPLKNKKRQIVPDQKYRQSHPAGFFAEYFTLPGKCNG
jgi:hypothetical protein